MISIACWLIGGLAVELSAPNSQISASSNPLAQVALAVAREKLYEAGLAAWRAENAHAGAEAEIAAARWIWSQASRASPIAAPRRYTDGCVELEVCLDVQAVASAPRANSGAAASASHELCATGVSCPGDEGLAQHPAGWQAYTWDGLQDSQAAARQLVAHRLLEALSNWPISAAATLGDLMKSSPELRRRVSDTLDTVIDVRVELGTDRLAHATGRVQLRDFVAAIEQARAADPNSPIRFADMLLYARQDAVYSVGTAPPPRSALLDHLRLPPQIAPSWAETRLAARGVCNLAGAAHGPWICEASALAQAHQLLLAELRALTADQLGVRPAQLPDRWEIDLGRCLGACRVRPPIEQADGLHAVDVELPLAGVARLIANRDRH